ncbi:hypothetical protein ACLX1H_010795 [Fusarium chlamydosporum]
MCQEIYYVYTPCAHSVYKGKTKCEDAAEPKKGLFKKGIFKKQFPTKDCEPRTGLEFIIDWCPACKTVFAEVIRHLGGIVPSNYRGLWDDRLLARYWSIKSQLRLSWAVGAETLGYQVFASTDDIEYKPMEIPGTEVEEGEEGSWELQALESHVHRLRPTFVWIKQDSESCLALEPREQLQLCERALRLTARKACDGGEVV